MISKGRGESGKIFLEIVVFGTLIGLPLAYFLQGGRTLNLQGDTMGHTQIILGIQAGSANLMEEDLSGISTYSVTDATVSVDRIRYLMERDLPTGSSECAEVYRALRLPNDFVGTCTFDWSVDNQGVDFPGCVLPPEAVTICEEQMRRDCIQPQSEIYGVCASVWNSSVPNSLRAAMIPNVTLLVIPSPPVGGGSSSSSSSSTSAGGSDPVDPDVSETEVLEPHGGFHPHGEF